MIVLLLEYSYVEVFEKKYDYCFTLVSKVTVSTYAL